MDAEVASSGTTSLQPTPLGQGPGLAEEVAALRKELEDLKAEFDDFRAQFD